MIAFCADEADRLAREHLPMVTRIAGRLTSRYPRDFDEAYSAGLVGLAKAVKGYRPEVADFAKFACKCVWDEIVSYFRDERPKGRSGTVKMPLMSDRIAASFTDQFDGHAEPAFAEHREPVGWEVEYQDWVAHLAAGLPAPHAEVFVSRHLHAEAEGTHGCAERLGLPLNRVVKLHHESLVILRGVSHA